MRCAVLVAFVAGVCLLQLQPVLPGAGALALLVLPTAAGVLAVLLHRHRLHPRVGPAVACTAAAVAGFAYAAAMATVRLSDELAFADEGKDILVEGVIASLPARLERGVRFEFEVERGLTPDVHVPRRLLLGWYDEAGFVQPAQRWRF